MPVALIVEDDVSIAEIIRLYLEREAFTVRIEHDGLSALAAAQSAPDIALFVLDIMLPGLDGRGLCRRLRQFTVAPIILVTALDDDRDKIEGLDLGADDFVTKPFNPQELMARVRAVMRRRSPVPAEPGERIAAGPLTLDLDRRTAVIGNHELDLRQREFDLLAALARRPGVVFSREQLLESAWHGEIEREETRTVDVHISRLRDRLAPHERAVRIDTVRSLGYRLVVAE